MIKYHNLFVDRSKQEFADSYASHLWAENARTGERVHLSSDERKDIEFYLKNHPNINKDMTIMVRQLAPDEYGIPLEIYCFTATTVWADYENIQSDIFDHIYSVLSEFGIKPYQYG